MKNQQFLSQIQGGYTLLEIIFTIAIIALLSSMAFPSFSTTLNNANIKSTRLRLLGDIRLLRSYALVQNTAAYLCALDPDGNCKRQTNWKHGWRAYMDNNQNLVFDAGDEVIIEHLNSNPLKIGVFIHSRWKNIKIDARGIIRSSGHFRICDPKKSGPRTMKVIRMNVHGRLGVEADKLECA